jgi:arsenate reductase-like glutaredoxin family protein
LRNDLKVELEERDYARDPLDLTELRDLFKGRDPRDFLSTKSPAFKAMGLQGKTLTAEQALKLMAQEPNLIRRPLVVVGREMIAGLDRDRLKQALR